MENRRRGRAGGYWVVDRTWENGDEVRVTLPMSLHVHPMPDDDTLQAIMYGPVVLAGDLGREGLTEEMRRGGDNPPEMPKPPAAPEFVTESRCFPIVDRADRQDAAYVPHQGAKPRCYADALQPDCRSAVRSVLARDAEAGVGRNRMARNKAIWEGAVLAESDDIVVVEGNKYFPPRHS
jgi:hypothetical protein